MNFLKICTINECGRVSYCRGYCKKHYYRFTKHGDPLGGRSFRGAAFNFITEVALEYVGSECLVFPFPLASTGYGDFKVDGKRYLAHRYVCEHFNGAPPSPDHEVAHGCGNRSCVNHAHLRWATAKENHADRVIHGTHLRGTNSPNAKLNEESAKEIIRLKGVKSLSELASEFGVSTRTIGRIHHGIRWSWVEAR